MKQEAQGSRRKKGHIKVALPADSSTISPPIENDAPTYIVGVGASAGGLEALEKLLKAMPVDTGMAFVIIQHLSPDFKSLMHELLARHTTMPIVRVDEPVEVRRNTVYLIPPRKEMVLSGNRLLTHDRPTDQAICMPINVFFRSLAREAKDRSIGIVLSGTGTDGSAGLLDIHDMNGLILVQSEQSAKFDGMPHSAIETGLADAVLEPEQMPSALKAYCDNPTSPLLSSKTTHSLTDGLVGLPAVIEKLREVYDIDFAHYKPATISRRIDRRISMVNCLSFQDYSNRVVKDSVELDALYKDLLIGVTRFFRDPEAFELIQKQVILPIVEASSAVDEIRVWVPGCATGEEAYTYAIMFLEASEATGRKPNVKIFATDVHRESLQLASDGIYTEASVAEVSPERRMRFFKHEGGRYRVNARLRKMLVFSPHNLIKDPPFTKMDIVSCRNLMIYFQPPAQIKALATMHFALKLQGVLVLGPSEGTSELNDEFESIDRQWKIFRKIKDSRLPLELRMSLAPAISPTNPRQGLPGDIRLARAYEGLLSRFVPTGALINEKRELLHVFGDAERYLRPPAGRMTTDIVGMARGDLRIALSSAIQNCIKRNERVSFKGVRIRSEKDDKELLMNLVVEPIPDKVANSTFMFVLFQDPMEVSALDATTSEQFEAGEASQARIRQLEQELQHTKESLQTTVEELETSNEELQASNEELLAANEELQSTNEELHSVNEELYSVNAEHEQKIRDLIEATNDLDNLMRSTEIGSIFLDSNHCIRLFTPAAREIFNVLPQDEGRDIKHITYRVKGDDIIDVINEVWKTHHLDEKQVTAQNGRAYLRRVMPYWDESRQIAGIVLTFVDVSELMAVERQLRLSEFSVNHASVPTFWIDDRGHILRVNRASCDILGYTEDQLMGLCIPDINSQFTEASWQDHWESLLGAKRMTFQSMFKHADGRMIDVEFESNWFEFEGSEYNFAFVRDITDRRKAEERIRHSEQLFRSTFELATVGLSHMAMDGKLLKANK